MATLVLSTVGNALGGPVGGAIGALIGQSLDQQFLGGSRRGPKIGDFSIQSSSYGTQIPRIYGRMRVAGSVIWATDLVEGAPTTGAKGQPDSVYSYSISIAVALGSRQILDVRRIWADGKLIRDETGTFKVNTIFRLYTGSEDQIVDPLIASAEGIANTPAYRGLAVAVFESLDLVEFGNRIPFLTFEVIADEGDPTVSAILAEASGGQIVCTEERTVGGYAAGGSSIRNAVQPIVDAFGIRLFDDEHGFSSESAVMNTIFEDDYGCSADGAKGAQRIERQQDASSSLPSALRLTYYDLDSDYQTGEARASAGELTGTTEQAELPAVIDAPSAGSLAQEKLARRWAARDRLTLRLPPKFALTQPGATLDLPLSPARWTVQRVELDSFVTNVELRPYWQPVAIAPLALAAVASPLRTLVAQAPVETAPVLELFDLPGPTPVDGDQPNLVLAASSSAPTWNRMSVAVHFGAQSIIVPAPLRKSLLGSAKSMLGVGDSHLLDLVNCVEVRLLDPDQWLTSCDDDALAAGCNLAVLGDEIIQFGEVTPLDGGLFRLRRLVRGRFGTEWAAGRHEIGERFLVLQPDTVRAVRLPEWAIGSTITAELIRIGQEPVLASLQYCGEGLLPPAPVQLQTNAQGGGLRLGWTRRSRRGWTWLDGIDAPLGESIERYAITLTRETHRLEFETGDPLLEIACSQLTSLGNGLARVEVRQVGDFGPSRAAAIDVELPGEIS